MANVSYIGKRKVFYSENVKKKILIAFDIFNQGRKPEV